MLIWVEHATDYTYSTPLLASTQYLRMTPLSGSTQAVETWKVSSPGARMTEWYDQYGNLCHTLTVAHPVNTLSIMVSGLVRTHDTNGVAGLALAELPSALYLRQTPYTVCSDSIRDYAARFRKSVARDRIEALHEIMMAIADDVEYKPGDTHVHTTGAEALEQGSGVCQDHAHIFCSVARTLGIPARYVSGYLSHGPGHEAHAASHAWADAYVDELGWVSFDPSNRVCATESHIRTATGLDYAEACPIRGVRTGGGMETMTFSVAFPSQQQQQSQ
ncbi:MAG: transglutaminase domain-containing protein [Methyloceanibacter sp.]